jgi:alpha-glucosidase
VPVEARQDPAWLRSGVTRDGARVPIPWRSDPAGSYGFSDGAPNGAPDGAPGATPWLPVPPPPEGTGRSGPHWGALSVAAQEDDPSSTLELARAAVQLRRRLHADGVLHPDDSATVRTTAAGLLEVERAGTLLAVNLGGAPSGLPEGELMLSSGPLARDGDLVLLPPDTAAWLRR